MKYELTLQVKYVLSLNLSVCLYSNSQSLTIQTVRINKLKTAEEGDNKPPVQVIFVRAATTYIFIDNINIIGWLFCVIVNQHFGDRM